MNVRALLPLLLLTACPESPSLAVFAETGLSLPLAADQVEGEVVVMIDALSIEDLELVDSGEDWFGRAGLRLEVVLSELSSGRVDVTPLDEAIGISQWSNPLLGPRSDVYNFRTDREDARWSEKFLLVRYIEEGECVADEPCEIRLPLALDRRRGRTEELRAQVRLGLHDRGAHWGFADREDAVALTAVWEMAD
ncbi:MAG: hypothetical protein EA397_16955 [Deltaproteobacteria bacterium]|nr:MAG: hypothetical protein EA397_16955 [Deltaproteobacteria bacterium]